VDVMVRTEQSLRIGARDAASTGSREHTAHAHRPGRSRFAAAMAAACIALHSAAAIADDRLAAVSWDALGRVTGTTVHDRYVPEFPKDLEALDGKLVRLDGFMMPLDEGAPMQTRFLIMPEPWDGDCLPVGAEQIVEVRARSAFKYVLDRITVQGRFALVRDDAGTLLYRLSDATPAER
jgi:uncharacterized protein